MHRHPPAHRAERPAHGIRAALAGLTVGALVLFGAPALAAADELPPNPEVAAAEPAAEPAEAPAAEPPAEPEPEPEPVVEPEPVEPAPVETEPEPAPAPEAVAGPPATEATAPAPEPAARSLATTGGDENGGPPVTTVPEWNDHVSICHATSSESNPYVFISPSVRSIIDPNGDPDDEYSGGHAHSVHQDFRDIIPVFDYKDEDGVLHTFPGLNTTKTEITEEDCNPAPPTMQLTAAVCTEVGGTPPPVKVALLGLLLGFEYTISVYTAGTDELVDSVTFSDVLDHDFELEPGSYDVILHRTGEDPENDLEKTITVQPCPRAPVPHWFLQKWSEPADGATVEPGDLITYTLQAYNDSDATVTGAEAFDDVSDVLDNGSIVDLGAGLTGPVGDVLTWDVLDLGPGDVATVSYTIEVGEGVFGELLHNVVTPGAGGECPSEEEPVLAERTANAVAVDDDLCVVDHPVVDIDLVLEKDAATEGGEPVDSGEDDVITYTLTITNVGTDPAYRSLVTDTLPDGVTYVDGSAVVSPNPGEWDPVEVADGVLTVQHDGWIFPGDQITITFEVTVGELAQPAPDQPIPDLVNGACVASEAYPEPEVPSIAVAEVEASEPGFDSNPDDNCDDAETPVKAIGLVGLAQCVNDTPWFTYSITPFNISDPGANPISLIWWTPEAFANRDPSIPADDVAALLADGASQVDPIAYPAGWASGDTISGQQLWPGAEVDADGNPTDWPGWTLLADGTWVLDPSAPFYDLRAEAVAEIRINPSNDADVVYPPPTPNCNAAPDQPSKPSSTPSTPSGLAESGVETSAMLPLGALLMLLGVAAVARGLRRRREG
ncbi:DUF11 domain-containing protein [Agromyces lapidis]|uniref:DUF11 domain-containing protein n=1 Tax=Agromyces lapidis TaxID=279574 RepID=A0ABV5SRV7_9MICO|nr:DUF11 domain-containing protein [Agromyces lapidis]